MAMQIFLFFIIITLFLSFSTGHDWHNKCQREILTLIDNQSAVFMCNN